MLTVRKLLAPFLLTAIGFIGLHFLWMALRLNVDFFDTFHIYENAKLISFKQPQISIQRSLLSSLLNVPLAFLDYRWNWEELLFRGSHVIAAAISLSFLGVAYLLFRLTFCRLWSLFGVFLLAINSMVIHYAAFAKEDMPAALLVAISFYGFLRGTRRYLLLAGVTAGLAMLLRYNLIPMLIPLFAIGSLRVRKEEMAERAALLIFLPMTLFMLFPTVVYAWIGRAPFAEALSVFVRELFWQFDNHRSVYQEPRATFSFLWSNFSLPFLALFIWGLATNLKRKNALFHAAWFLLFFFIQTFVMFGKEVRYLIPLFIPMIFFTIAGFQDLVERLKSRPLRLAMLGLLIFGTYVIAGAQEIFHHRDPFYSQGVAKKAATYAAKLAGENGRLIWSGEFYPSFPRYHFFNHYDAFTYVFHIHTHVIEFFARKNVGTLNGGKALLAADKSHAILPGAEKVLKKGDVVIVSLAPTHTFTMNLPQDLPPLYVQKVKSVQPLTWENVATF